jgi:hypothetical protein
MAIFLPVLEISVGDPVLCTLRCTHSDCQEAPAGKRGEVTADDVVAAALRPTGSRRSDERRSPLGGVTVSFFDFAPQIPCPIGEEHMIVIGKGSMIRPDALTPHIIDDEMRVLGELKAEGVVRSAYRRSEGPGFYLLAEGPSIDAVRERIDNTLPFVVENLATVEYDVIYEI